MQIVNAEFQFYAVISHLCYAVMTLNDNTEIVHSEVLPDGRVRVHVETPDKLDGPFC